MTIRATALLRRGESLIQRNHLTTSRAKIIEWRRRYKKIPLCRETYGVHLKFCTGQSGTETMTLTCLDGSNPDRKLLVITAVRKRHNDSQEHAEVSVPFEDGVGDREWRRATPFEQRRARRLMDAMKSKLAEKESV